MRKKEITFLPGAYAGFTPASWPSAISISKFFFSQNGDSDSDPDFAEPKKRGSASQRLNPFFGFMARSISGKCRGLLGLFEVEGRISQEMIVMKIAENLVVDPSIGAKFPDQLDPGTV